MMTFGDYRRLIVSDLYRHGGRRGARRLLDAVLWGEGTNFMFWFRTCAYLRSRRWLKYTLFPLAKWRFRAATYRYGISIPYSTRIGAGFYIGHFSGIVVSDQAVIGRDCNISQGVTLGWKPGAKGGAPVIGNEVYIGPGAKVVGGVQIGDRVVIGANAVVTSDVPPDTVVVGIPARAVGSHRANEYVEFRSTDLYPVA